MPKTTLTLLVAGVAVDRTGGVLVADDVGNTIWRIAPAGAVSATASP
jgi:glucose/arabinose dehydrogenase